MTHPSGSSEQAVAALFAERERYEGWLAALEAKRASTPAHIFERVHADYAARLQRVMEQFQEHREVIQGMADALVERITVLDIEDAKQHDARVEAELRAAVGEFTASECQECVRRTEEARAAISIDRAGLMAELSRLRALLDTDQPAVRVRIEPPIMSVSTAAAAPGAAISAAAPPAPSEPRAEDSADLADGRTDGGSAFDELEFLKSVVDSRADEGRGRSPAPAPADEGPEAESRVGSSVFEEPGRADAPAGSVTASAGIAPGEESPNDSRVTTASDSPDAAATRPRTPAFLRDVPQEQVKTLKCQECQAMNYPTEWYCERCGAELAAL